MALEVLAPVVPLFPSVEGLLISSSEDSLSEDLAGLARFAALAVRPLASLPDLLALVGLAALWGFGCLFRYARRHMSTAKPMVARPLDH